mmetsp:Transcript_11169/g.46641  ORF Transcript_11169/g.46641 Transcript_11169/m.46641 type:complete len:132 (-) Transcript_11169:1627-2022(-)
MFLQAKRAFLRHAPETAFDIRILHSRVTNEEQKRAFERPAKGRRKVVLSTNIAETSVTIEDVVFVIDSGLQNSLGYEVRSSLPSLQPDWISQANARQRAGRAVRRKRIPFEFAQSMSSHIRVSRAGANGTW